MPSRSRKCALDALLDDGCTYLERETSELHKEIARSKKYHHLRPHVVLSRRISAMVGDLVRESRHLTKIDKTKDDSNQSSTFKDSAPRRSGLDRTTSVVEPAKRSSKPESAPELLLGGSSLLARTRTVVQRDPSPDRGYGFHALKVGKNVFLVHRYLGPWYARLIDGFNDIGKDFRPPEGIALDLSELQKVAVAKMKNGVTGPFRSCLLIDETGLDKTITTCASIIPLNRLSPGPFFEPEDLGKAYITVIVTTNSARSAWEAELRRCFEKQWRPRILVLDSKKDVTLDEIRSRQYHVIIVAYSFLALQFRRAIGYERFVEAVKRDGLEAAQHLAKANHWPTKMPRLPMHPETWDFFNMRIATLVADNFHAINDEQRMALKSLPYDSFVALSDTLFKNRWSETFNVLDLLPLSPFDRDTFWRVFGDSDTPHMRPLLEADEDRLVKFLLGFTIWPSHGIRRPGTESISDRRLISRLRSSLDKTPAVPEIMPYYSSLPQIER